MNAQTNSSRSWIARYVPALEWMPHYQTAWLRSDLLAGLTTAAVVIPQAMAYATIAGLPIQVGLYTALVPMIIYAFLGTSRPLSVSSTSTISMLVATNLLLVPQGSASAAYLTTAVTLALLVGLFLVIASLLRLGFVADFISQPVLTGFKAGVGIVIFVGQLGKVLGMPIEQGPFFQTILSLIISLGHIHWPTVILSVVTLALVLGLPGRAASVVAVAAGIAASLLLNLGSYGVELVGEVPPGLPGISLPDPPLIMQLWPGALGIALMSFIESIAAARVFARADDPPVDANQELLALGVANIGGSFFQTYPAGGGTSQTAVADQTGAKSPLTGLVVAGLVIITLIFLSPLISLMPEATLGVLVLVAAAGLVKVQDFQQITNFRRVEFRWALIAFVGVILLGTLEGILVAVIASLLVILYHAHRPPVYVLARKADTDIFRPLTDHPQDETVPGLLIARTEGLLFFANASLAIEQLWNLKQENQPQVLVVDCSAVPNIEYTALKLLDEFEERLRADGTILWLAALTPGALEAVERVPLGQRLGHTRMFYTLPQVVETFQAQHGTTTLAKSND